MRARHKLLSVNALVKACEKQTTAMRLADFSDYLKLRGIAANPWEIVRFRTKQKPETDLVVRLHDGEPFLVRGGLREYHIFRQMFLKDEYELDALPPGCWDCVVDLGANAGFFSIRAARLARRVIAYEPFAGNCEQLRRNVGSRNVEVVQAAVAANDGVQRLYHPASSRLTGSYSLISERDVPMSEHYDEVPSVSLQTLFERHGIETCDLLKLDVEGAEYAILYGADAATMGRIQRIHCEYHILPTDDRARVETLVDCLRAHGFEVQFAPHGRKPTEGLLYAVRSDLVEGPAP